MQMTNFEKKARYYKALSEPARLRIIRYLIDKDKCSCICELSRLLKKDQSVIFRHIKILEDAGIIRCRKEKKFLFCCIKNPEKTRDILKK